MSRGRPIHNLEVGRDGCRMNWVMGRLFLFCFGYLRQYLLTMVPLKGDALSVITARLSCGKAFIQRGFVPEPRQG